MQAFKLLYVSPETNLAVCIDSPDIEYRFFLGYCIAVQICGSSRTRAN
jgi:hypothetical protein